MATYSVSQARDNLSRLIDRALGGGEVVITRRGRIVAELRAPLQRPVGNVDHAWLDRQRASRSAIDGPDSVTLLRQLHDETSW